MKPQDAGSGRHARVTPAGRSAAEGKEAPRWHSWSASIGVATVVAIAYTAFAIWQWSQFIVRSWDLSIFTQALRSYAQFGPPIVNVKGDGFNLLGDHFHPLLALLAPVHAIFPSAFTLLAVQALCFALAAGILTRAATRSLRTTTGGVLLGLAFGLSWGLQYAAESQFHEVALAVPLLTGALTAVLERRWSAAACWAAPLVFVKEDLGLTVVAIGLLIAYLSRRPLGLWLAVWGAGWVAIATLVVIPLLNPNRSWAYAGTVNPVAALADPAGLFELSKGHTLLLLIVTTGGLIVMSPIALTLIPTIAWRFLSTEPAYWGPSWHYSAILMPIAFVALLDAVERGRSSRWGWMRRYSRHGATISIAAAALILPTLPLWTIVRPAAWAPPERADAAIATLDAVPVAASIETDVGLMAYLVDSHDVYWIGNANPTPDCLLVDLLAGGTPGDWGDVLDVARRLHPMWTYVVIEQTAGYELACR